MATLLEVNNLRTNFYTQDGVVNAVQGVSFSLDEGETLGIVGESGSGKSVTALSIMRLIQPPGQDRIGRDDLQGRRPAEVQQRRDAHIRGKEIAMIFQDPMSSLNPVLTISKQIGEVAATAYGHDQEAGAHAHHRASKAGGHTIRGTAHGQLSAPVLGRHAPACDDCNGPVVQPQAADRRRTDHSARCNHTGADPRPYQRG